MATSYGTFGNFLLLKQRAQDGLGSLWRAGEMERGGFKRIVWLRRFDQVGFDRAALEPRPDCSTRSVRCSRRRTSFARRVRHRGHDSVHRMGVRALATARQLLARVEKEQFPVAIDNALLITEKIARASPPPWPSRWVASR